MLEFLETLDDGIEHSFSIHSGEFAPFSLRLGVQTEGVDKIAEIDSNLYFLNNDEPIFVYLHYTMFNL